MKNGEHVAVTDAVILMAGAASRLDGMLKPLVEIGGRPLISYTLEALERAGIENIHIVLGARGEGLVRGMTGLVPATMQLHTIDNPEWRKQNGVSVLAAAGKVRAPFLLTMGDHLFEYAVIEALLRDGDRSCVNLAVDRNIEGIFDIDDATKVATENDRIVAIGKDLTHYDAIDTGVFLCSDDILSGLKRAQRNGDCSLSDGIRLLGAEGKARVVEIGDAWWQDVDTPEMLEQAERMSARFLRKGGRGLAQVSVAGQD